MSASTDEVAGPSPETDSLDHFTDRELLEIVAKQVDWLTNAVHQIGQQTGQTAGMLNMIVQGLMASPMGGMIKKQMGGN